MELCFQPEFGQKKIRIDKLEIKTNLGGKVLKTLAVGLSLLALSGRTCGTHLGYMTGTTVGLEISTGATNATPPTSFVLGYKRAEMLVTPTGTTEVPSVLGKVGGQIGSEDADAGMSGNQFFAVGEAASELSKDINIREKK